MVLLSVGVMANIQAIRRRRPKVKKTQATDLELRSAAFPDNGSIPSVYTCDGDEISPPLRWEKVPKGTKSFALICNDPDARGGKWIHWLVFNLPAKIKYLPANANISYYKGIEGVNNWGTNDYGGPCPPVRKHRYTFSLYALSEPLRLTKQAKADAVQRAMQGKILAKTTLTGTYQRAQK